MPYDTLAKQIQAVPEEYLDEVAEYIDFILFKVSRKPEMQKNKTSRYYGSITRPIDGMEAQRSMRNDWD